MAICEPKPIDKEEEELTYYIVDSDDDSVDSEDSEEDPTYEIMEETRSNLSNLSIKKPKSRVSKKAEIGSDDEEEDEVSEVKVPELSEKDAKSFEEIEKIIQAAGQLEKLKVEQCKIYLRKYGLRLTGKKEILMERIREHLEVVDGRGEKKYPPSSFVLNCKGDACTGDVVMFEQNVYDMYSIVSRSATAPPLGTRVVVGRIVKESYGAAKQQHTFTIEVLWSKGEKPLPPLHPLLIKGRNLYRLKTMRQRWADEGERRRVLQEKHSRGSLARCSRDTRIQAKELRMHAGGKRLKKNTTTITTTTTNNNNKENKNQLQVPAVMVPSQDHLSNHRPQPLQQHYNIPAVPAPALLHHNYKHPMSQHCNNIPVVPAPTLLHHNFHFPVQAQQSTVIGAHRQPLANMNSHPRPRDRSQNYPTQDRPRNQLAQGRREPCRFYPQGRCYYGDSCKYLHH